MYCPYAINISSNRSYIYMMSGCFHDFLSNAREHSEQTHTHTQHTHHYRLAQYMYWSFRYTDILWMWIIHVYRPDTTHKHTHVHKVQTGCYQSIYINDTLFHYINNMMFSISPLILPTRFDSQSFEYRNRHELVDSLPARDNRNFW